MLSQEKISGPDTLLKLSVASDDDRKARQPQLQTQYLPRDPRGGTPTLGAAEILTILVGGAWRGLTDKATGIFTPRPIIGGSSRRWEHIASLSRRRIGRAASCGHCGPWGCTVTAKRQARIRACCKTPPRSPSVTSRGHTTIAPFGRGPVNPRTGGAGGTALSCMPSATTPDGSVALM